jgi:hypothetical protein
MRARTATDSLGCARARPPCDSSRPLDVGTGARDRHAAILLLSPPRSFPSGQAQMGQRTRELPPLTGTAHFARELRYSEIGRQGLGLVLMPFYALFAEPRTALFAAGATLAVLGAIVRLYASGYIVKNQQLATDGPYSLVRHPLYTGNLLLLAGFTVASGLWWAVIASAAFWWFYYPPAIEYEDRKLRRIFGEPCVEWQRTTPAVIPRSLLSVRGGAWSLATSLSRNAEPLVLAYTFFWLWWIYRQL